jgi:hypothetical protein
MALFDKFERTLARSRPILHDRMSTRSPTTLPKEELPYEDEVPYEEVM